MTIPRMTASTEAAQWMAKIIGVDWAVFDRNTGDSRTYSRLPQRTKDRVRLWSAIQASWGWSPTEIARYTGCPNRSTIQTAFKAQGVDVSKFPQISAAVDEAYGMANESVKNARPVQVVAPIVVIRQERSARRKRNRCGCECKCANCVRLTWVATRILARDPGVNPEMLEPIVRPFVRQLRRIRAMGMTA